MDEVFALLLGELSMEGGGGHDGYYVRGIVGWDAMPDARGSLDAIPGSDGSFHAVDLYRESRVVTVVGVMAAATRFEVEALRARLMSTLKAHASLSVTDELGTLSSDVRVDSIRFSDEGTWATWIDFTIDLIAPDPIRYRDPVVMGPLGRQKVVGGLRFPGRFPWSFGQLVGGTQLEVPNAGSVPMFPLLHIEGGFSGVTVTDRTTGRAISFGAVARGETLTIDTKSRRASVNGRDESRRLVKRGWPIIQPESTGVFTAMYESPTGDPTLSVESCEGAW